MWLLSAALAVVCSLSVACIAAAGAFAFAWSRANAKFKKQLHSVTARYDAVLKQTQHAGAGGRAGGPDSDGGSSGGVAAMYESFTLGWLNLLVQHMWLPVLEKLVSSIAAEKLQIVLNDVLRKFGRNGPWNYIESVAVEVVTFGLAPPQFQFCTAKYDPARSYLLLSMDMLYHSSCLQAVLSARVRGGRLWRPFTLRLEVLQLRLAGRLQLGLHLSKEPPGIKGVDYSFASPPDFDIQASPVGVVGLNGELSGMSSQLRTLLQALIDLPGMIGKLRSLLQNVFSKKVVEPNRKYLDLQRIYQNKYVQRIGGPGGCLRVSVIGGRNLIGLSAAANTNASTAAAAGAAAAAPTAFGTSSSAGAAPTGPAAASLASPFTTGAGASTGPGPGPATAADCDPYVEMRFGREVFRTPIVHHTADPVYSWQFDVRLPEDLPPLPSAAADGAGGDAPQSARGSGGREVLLVFRVMNARTLGEPEVLSSGVLDAAALGLAPNAEPRARLLPLTAPGSAGPRGTLSLQISWLKAQPKKASPFPQDAVPAATAASAITPAASAAATSSAATPASARTPTPTSTPHPAVSNMTTPLPRRNRQPTGLSSPYASSAAATPAAQATPSPGLTPADSFQRDMASPVGVAGGGGVGGDAHNPGIRRHRTDLISSAADAVLSYVRDVTGSGPMPQGDGAGESSTSAAYGRYHRVTASSSSTSFTHAVDAMLAGVAVDTVPGAAAACRPSPYSPVSSARGPTAAAYERSTAQPLTTEATLAGPAVSGMPHRQSTAPIRSIHVTANGSEAAPAAAAANGARNSTFGAALEQAIAAASDTHILAASPALSMRVSRPGVPGGGDSLGGSAVGSALRASRPEHPGPEQQRPQHPGHAGQPGQRKHRRTISGLLSRDRWRPLWGGGGGSSSARDSRKAGRTAGGGEGAGGELQVTKKTLSATSGTAAAASRTAVKGSGAGAGASASTPHNALRAVHITLHHNHHLRTSSHRLASPAAAANGSVSGARAASVVMATGGSVASVRDCSGPEDLFSLPLREALPPVFSVPHPEPDDEADEAGASVRGSLGRTADAAAEPEARIDGVQTPPAPVSVSGLGAVAGQGPRSEAGDACRVIAAAAQPAVMLELAARTGDASHRSRRRVSQSSRLSQPGTADDRSQRTSQDTAVALTEAADGGTPGAGVGQGPQPEPRTHETPFERAKFQSQILPQLQECMEAAGGSAAAPTGNGERGTATASVEQPHSTFGIGHLGSVSVATSQSYDAQSYGNSYAATPLAPAGPSASTVSGGGGASPFPYDAPSPSTVGRRAEPAAESAAAQPTLLSPPASGRGAGQQWPSTLQSLAQVVKLQSLLQVERASNTELRAALRDARKRCESLAS